MSTLDRAVVDSAAAQPRPYAVARRLLVYAGAMALSVVWGLLSSLESELGFALILLLLGGAIAFLGLVVGPIRRRREEERLGGADQPVRFDAALRSGLVPDGASVDRWRTWVPTALARARVELRTMPWIWTMALVAVPLTLALNALSGSGTRDMPWWFLPGAALVAWPVMWWDARRKERRLRRLAAVLDVDAS